MIDYIFLGLNSVQTLLICYLLYLSIKASRPDSSPNDPTQKQEKQHEKEEPVKVSRVYSQKKDLDAVMKGKVVDPFD
jgi:hypothetical protein